MRLTDKKWIKIMQFGEWLGCHQIPERSFFCAGYQFPVCARCTGVIISSIIATLVFNKKMISLDTAFGMSSIMLADWLIQHYGIKESTNARRLITGLIGGYGCTTIQLYGYKYVWSKMYEIIKYVNKKHSVTE